MAVRLAVSVDKFQATQTIGAPVVRDQPEPGSHRFSRLPLPALLSLPLGSRSSFDRRLDVERHIENRVSGPRSSLLEPNRKAERLHSRGGRSCERAFHTSEPSLGD